jgi:dienelactone hydrolase
MGLIEYRPSPSDNFLVRAFKRISTTLRLIPHIFRFVYYCRAALVKPRVLGFMSALRSQAPDVKVGVAGFCWGGYYAIGLTHDRPENFITVDGKAVPLVDCAFTAHPSMVKVPEEIEAVEKPLSVANGDDDQYMGREKMAQLTKILEDKNAKLGKEVHEVEVYPGAKHGFAVRGDREDSLQRERGERSEEQAVRWFRKQFTGRS